MQDIFFSDSSNALRIFVTSLCGYLAIVAILRISGTRTLSKMNSFDFVVTIALGSIVATGILQKSVALFDMLLGFGLLVGLQFGATWLAVRHSKINNFLKASPILLYAEGELLPKAMKKAHVTEDEILSACRHQGLDGLEQVKYVVIESNGKVVAVRKS